MGFDHQQRTRGPDLPLSKTLDGAIMASQTGIWGISVKNILRDPDQLADTLAYTA
jgi:hypothetical protein